MKQSGAWDEVSVPNVKSDDLDIAAFQEFRNKAVKSNRLRDSDVAVSDDILLENLILKNGDSLTRAAVLLFHKNPAEHGNLIS